MIGVNDLRQGVLFVYEGKTYQVLAFYRHKVARARGIVNVNVKDVESGGVREITFKSDDKVDEADLSNLILSFVYHDQRKQKLIFTDTNTKKRIELDENILSKDQVGYLVEGTNVTALAEVGERGDIKIYSVMLPKVVELKVTQAPPSEKGDTASGGSKPVIVETGATVNTPFFVKEGDIIRVNTETNEYSGRA